MYAIRSYYEAEDSLQYGKKSDGNDPYRKYDEGFVKYDYSQLAYDEAPREVTVITSYSIHYTKLYEKT